MSKRHWWYLDPGGSLLGLALAVASVTPSLLPRPALLQGAVAAVAFGLGYLVGVGVWAVLSRLVPQRLLARCGHPKRADGSATPCR